MAEQRMRVSEAASAFDPRTNTFLARQAYRRRRLMDAARLLPAFGLALFLMPTLWISVEVPGETAIGFVYIFAIWFVLIAVGFILARRIAGPVPSRVPPEDEPGDA